MKTVAEELNEEAEDDVFVAAFFEGDAESSGHEPRVVLKEGPEAASSSARSETFKGTGLMLCFLAPVELHTVTVRVVSV